jgi:hypothetical protein
MGFPEIEGELDFRAFWKNVSTKVPDFDPKRLVETKKALKRDRRASAVMLGRYVAFHGIRNRSRGETLVEKEGGER